jgi:hypothetical protein
MEVCHQKLMETNSTVTSYIQYGTFPYPIDSCYKKAEPDQGKIQALVQKLRKMMHNSIKLREQLDHLP